jgi:hypothetical protein
MDNSECPIVGDIDGCQVRSIRNVQESQHAAVIGDIYDMGNMVLQLQADPGMRIVGCILIVWHLDTGIVRA